MERTSINGNFRSKHQSNSIVKLNIGGFKYITTKSTLLGTFRSPEPNFFSALLNGEMPTSKIDDWIFIDRDGQYFSPILEFLRTDDVVIPAGMNVNSVLREAEYFGIKFPLSESNEASLTYVTDEWLTKKSHDRQYNRISNLADDILVDVLSQFKKCAEQGVAISTTIWLRDPQSDYLMEAAINLARKAKRQHETQDIKAAFQSEVTKTVASIAKEKAIVSNEYFGCLDDPTHRSVLVQKCSSNYLGVQIESITVSINWKGTVESIPIGYYFIHTGCGSGPGSPTLQ